MIYVYDRHPCRDERGGISSFVRRPDPSSSLLPTSSKLRYKNCTFISQPSGCCIIYLVNGLHYKHHGSTDSAYVPYFESVLASRSIPCATILRPLVCSNGRLGTCSKNGVTVLDSDSAHLTNLHDSIKGGFLNFHKELASHIIKYLPAEDLSRVAGRIDNRRSSTNLCLRFGFAREQRICKKTIFFDGIKLPTIDVDPFLRLPKHLQLSVVKVLQTGTRIVRKKLPGSFCDHHRTSIYARYLNAKLGFPKSTNKFEYVDIVLSHNTILPGHLDTKNDHRDGYNLCLVYSFSTNIDGRIYRVAVIMTSRSSVGANLDKIITD